MSTIGLSDLRACRPEVLSTVAGLLEDRRRALVVVVGTVLRARCLVLSGRGAARAGGAGGAVGAGGALRHGGTAGAGGTPAQGGAHLAMSRWSGPAANAAGARFGVLAGEVARVAGDLGVASQALSHAALRLRAALALIARAESSARERGGHVDERGQILLPARAPSGDAVLDAHEARADVVMREEVAAYLRQAQCVAHETDVELARRLALGAHGALAAGERGVLPALRPPGVVAATGAPSPGDVFASAAWWQSLTSEDRGRILREHPEWVGPRDGLPAADRDQANRVLLDRAERAALSRMLALEAGGEPLPDEQGAGGPAVFAMGLSDRGTALGLTRRRLDALRAVRRVLSRQDGARRRLLLLDVSGRHPRAAVAIGEVDTAEHVTTFVGGFTTTVADDLERHDGDLARLRSGALALARGDVAVVSWLGYAAPQSDEVLSPSRTVLSAGVAAEGGASLAAFVTGLDASREVPPDQSVLSHSYGSVVLSFALRRPTGIDRVALLGSPGTGGAVRSIVDTGLKQGTFNVLGSVDDPVVVAGRLLLGPPARDVDGATSLSTYAPGGTGSDARRTSHGHSDYLKAGSDSATNLVAIIADRSDATIPESAAERARKVL